MLSEIANNDALSDDDIIDSVRVMIFGGLETTAALLANTTWALLTHPEQNQATRSATAILKNAIEETMRWESPVQTCTRHVTRDVELCGVMLCPGDTLQCMLGAAGRDETHFSQPDKFDVRRANAGEHVGFGSGKHFCIGAALARTEAYIGLTALFHRLPALHLLNADEDRPQGHEFRSPPRLRIAW